MAKVENIEELLFKVKVRKEEARKLTEASVIVGYSASYALYVHENLEAKHPVGQAKYLEAPLRNNRQRYHELLVGYITQGISYVQSLFRVGLALQRDSQQLVPVDTGNLKGSAFTELVD